MALRTTRQFIEVLGTSDDGELRVTKQCLSVPITEAASTRVYRQCIEVLAGPAGGDIYEIAADSEITLSDESIGAFIIEVSADSTISLNHESYLNLEGISTLSLDCSSDWDASYAEQATSDASVTDEAIRIATFQRSVSHALTLGQGLEYVGPRLASATTEIEFDQIGYLCQEWQASAKTTISLAGSTIPAGTIRAECSNAITFIQYADESTYPRWATNEVELSQEATYEYCHGARSDLELDQHAYQGQLFVWATNALELDYIVRPNPLTIGPDPGDDFKLYGNTIEFDNFAHSSIQNVTASSALTLTQSHDLRRPWPVSATNALQTTSLVFDTETGTYVEVVTGLIDEVSAVWVSNAPKEFHQYLQLTQSALAVKVIPSAESLSAESTLSFSQAAYKNVTGAAHTIWALAQSADGYIANSCDEELELADTADVVAIRDLAAESSLSLRQAFGYVSASVSLCQYAPKIGGSDDPSLPTPPAETLTEPLTGIEEKCQLVYPASGEVTDSVALRAPNFGNKDRLAFNRVVRETRGGSLIVYADPIWPKIQTLVLNFSGLTRTEATDLLSFIETHLGLEVGFIDWEHRYWKGIIITSEAPIIEDQLNQFSASFNLEGEMDPSWSPA